jgi:capsular polysaccharide biosynthesis protein
MELSILEIIHILFKKVWVIILATVIGFSAAFLVSTYLIAPTYTSSCQMYVNPGNAESSTGTYIGDYTDLQYAQKLVNSYIIILKTDTFLEDVAATADLPYSAEQIRKMLSLSSINNTEFFEVGIESKKATDSYNLVRTITELAPSEIMRIRESDSVKIVSPATNPIAPSSPNILLNAMIGALLAFVAAAAIVILVEVLDTRVKSEEDISSHYDIPVIGCIPMYEEE